MTFLVCSCRLSIHLFMANVSLLSFCISTAFEPMLIVKDGLVESANQAATILTEYLTEELREKIVYTEPGCRKELTSDLSIPAHTVPGLDG